MHSLLVKCENCGNLQSLLSKIECSILYAISRKHAILTLNLQDNFDEEKFKDLLRYKRIVSRRIYDCDYPSSTIKTSSIVERASFLALRSGNCSQCPDCFPDINE